MTNVSSVFPMACRFKIERSLKSDRGGWIMDQVKKMERDKLRNSTLPVRDAAKRDRGCRDTAMMISNYKQDQVTKLPLQQAEPGAELAEHIFDQLRTSYDRLLHEPIPPRLQMLLRDLATRESDH
jgi:Anti-sigma factor NepR